jgi:hypothetical protein
MKLAYVVTTLALLSAGACKPNPHECTATAIHNDDPQLWTAVFSACGDKKKYGVTCTPDTTNVTAGILTCTCTVDSVSDKTFPFTTEMPSDPATLKAVFNAECGWTLE